MNEQEIDSRFGNLMQPQVTNNIIKIKKDPAKFPELRYLWGIALLGSFVLVVLSAVISTVLESL